MKDITISTPLIPDDIPDIQEVFYRTWMDTYPNKDVGITKEDIEVYFEKRNDPEYIATRANDLSHLPPTRIFFVAKHGDRVVGVSGATIREGHNQLQSIYVLPEYQGNGIGKMFWGELLKFFDPSKKIIVHVATYNTKAIAFYTKLGFADTGKRFTEERHRMPISGSLVPEMEMEILRW